MIETIRAPKVKEGKSVNYAAIHCLGKIYLVVFFNFLIRSLYQNLEIWISQQVIKRRGQDLGGPLAPKDHLRSARIASQILHLLGGLWPWPPIHCSLSPMKPNDVRPRFPHLAISLMMARGVHRHRDFSSASMHISIADAVAHDDECIFRVFLHHYFI
jgi:hypothetical protein